MSNVYFTDREMFEYYNQTFKRLTYDLSTIKQAFENHRVPDLDRSFWSLHFHFTEQQRLGIKAVMEMCAHCFRKGSFARNWALMECFIADQLLNIDIEINPSS